MTGKLARAAAIAALVSSLGSAAWAAPRLETPAVAFSGGRVEATLTDAALEPGETSRVLLVAGDARLDTLLTGGEPLTVALAARDLAMGVTVDGSPVEIRTRVLPGWLTLLPPLIAIATALITRQVVLSLLAGIYIGALFLARFDAWHAFTATLDRYVVGSLSLDGGHVSIVFIASILGGMSGVISRSGGARAIADRITARAHDARSGLVSTWAAGLVIFFDDYANTLIVGNMMRPLTDRLRISREKLSFLVDATAAPVASIAPISTWIGFEVGLIHDALAGLGLERDAYGLFLSSIPYRFYPIFLLVLGFAVAWTGRDFGAMWRAESRARSGGGVLAPGAEPLMDTGSDEPEPGVSEHESHAHASNALLPILVVILATFGGILLTGWQATAGSDDRSLRALFGAGDSYEALLWAGTMGSIAAVALAVGRRALALGRAVAAWVDGVRSMSMAVIILVLAWGIGAVCSEMGTADIIVGWLGGRFPAVLLPATVFLVSAAVSFATGTSWGTMAILMPIVLPLGYTLGGGSELVLVGAVSSVLAGSVFGDHCSPISDTTVLSSLASGADHVDHVRTQLPYALATGVIGVVVGDLMTALGVPVLVSLVVGAALVVALVRFVGKKPETV